MDYFLAFLIGCIIGSFLNVVILRQSIGGKRRRRSICLSCGMEIGDRDLFPVVSFIALWGRCRNCRSRISFQYPIVELMTGLFFVLAYVHSFEYSSFEMKILEAFSLGMIGAVLTVIFVYDLRHKIIPDWSAVTLGVLAFIHLLINYGIGSQLMSRDFLYDLSAGLLAPLPFFLLWLISRGKWMGLGDAKLMVGLGLLLGMALWPSGIILSFWLATFIVLGLMVLGTLSPIFPGFKPFKSLSRKSEVPLGPFLIAGCLIVFFLELNIFKFFMVF